MTIGYVTVVEFLEMAVWCLLTLLQHPKQCYGLCSILFSGC